MPVCPAAIRRPDHKRNPTVFWGGIRKCLQMQKFAAAPLAAPEQNQHIVDLTVAGDPKRKNPAKLQDFYP
jgi:hypothetical protein